MARWTSDTRARLEQAAVELYLERGFEATTVADIAGRVGLTERTFFRHFADKREVLFGDAHLFQDAVVQVAATALASAAPLEAVIQGFETVGVFFQAQAERSRLRQSIIDATPELQARELIKLSALAAALTRTLHQRGISGPAASLAAEVGIVVFKRAFERCIDPANTQPWAELVRVALEELRAVISD